MLAALLDLVLQDHCVGCSALLPPGGTWCEPCSDTVVVTEHQPQCPLCGDLVGASLCGRCMARPPAFSSVAAPLEFGGAVRDAVHQLKFSNAPWVAAPLARWCASLRPLPSVDVWVPIPLHPVRHRERGYNQAALLAQTFAGCSGGVLHPHALRRVKATQPVAGLHPNERQEQVKDAFEVAQPQAIVGRRVGLVDDVMTTGATVREASLRLKDAGAANVDVVCVARGGWASA